MKLDNLAAIYSGYQFRERVEPHPDGNISVIQVKDLRDGGMLDASAMIKVKLDKDPASSLVRPGDVLFLSRGHRLFAVALVDPVPPAVVPSYFYVIRPFGPEVSPGYLAWYLNQPPAQNRMKPSHAGSNMPLVSKSAFSGLEIEVPPLHIQHAIVALAALSRREGQLVAELADLRRQMIERTCLRAVNNNTEGS